jgi:hypothetical protein
MACHAFLALLECAKQYITVLRVAFLAIRGDALQGGA